MRFLQRMARLSTALVLLAPATAASASPLAFDLDLSFHVITDLFVADQPVSPDATAVLVNEIRELQYRANVRVRGNADPYLAFRIELTNLSASPFATSFSLLMSTVQFGAGYELRAVLDTTLIDSNADGSASWTLAGGGFGIVESSSQIASLLPPIDHSLDFEDMLTDVRTSFVPPGADWDRLHALGFGNLSAGDTLVIEGFLCATPFGVPCPARPVLTPEASSAALLGVALALLGATPGKRVKAERRSCRQDDSERPSPQGSRPVTR
jgi:hypothetical protein